MNTFRASPKPPVLAPTAASRLSCFCLLLCLCLQALAQNPLDGFAASTNGPVQTVKQTPGGHLLIAGEFTDFNGQPALDYLVRTTIDGAPDGTFLPGFSDHVLDVVVLPNSQVVAVGRFTQVNGQARNHVARLNADGSLDSGFAVNTDDEVYAIARQADGRLLLGGRFTQVNGSAINRLVRLLPDGSVDGSFDIGGGFADGTVRSVLVQKDGRIVVGGSFSEFNGQVIANLVRLHPNGDLDDSLSSVANGGANQVVRSLHQQSDDKLLVAGQFTAINGVSQAYLSRFNVDGSFDAGFQPNINSSVLSVTQLQGGDVLIGGAFTSVNGSNARLVTVLRLNGTLDSAFSQAAPTINGLVYSAMEQADGEVLLGGIFQSVNDPSIENLTRLTRHGHLDTDMDIGVFGNLGSHINALAINSADETFVGGFFNFAGGLGHQNLFKIAADGAVDGGFTASTDGVVNGLATQYDATGLFTRVLVVGDFTQINGSSRGNIGRLLNSGALDGSFLADVNGRVDAVAVLPDRRILIGGLFDHVNLMPRNNLALLAPDGALVNAFNVDVNSAVNSVAVTPDGRLIIGGVFTQVNGVNREKIAELLLVGDQGFVTAFDPSPDGNITALMPQSDGRIWVGGTFDQIAGGARRGLARLLANGGLDGSVDVPLNTSGHVRSFALQANGKMIIAGQFNSVEGQPRNRVARLSPGVLNGQMHVDDFVANTDDIVNAAMLQGNGKLLIGGHFTQVNGTGRDLLARLKHDEHAGHQHRIGALQLRWRPLGSAPEPVGPVMARLFDGTTLHELGPLLHVKDGWQINHGAQPGPDTAMTSRVLTRGSGGRRNAGNATHEWLRQAQITDLIFADDFE